MSDFLLEIGTEEIPHWMIPSALEQLAKFDVLGEVLSVDATPRRLVLRATDVPERTPDVQQIIKGPPVSAGDKAAAGFAKKQGVELSAMQKIGDYYELRKHVPGRLAIDILAETLPAAILGLQWSKTMYWVGGKTGPRFIRPIRWIVALLGNEVIPFEIAGVKSSNVTRGHRQLGSSSIPVTIANYESELRKNFVISSSEERRKKIETEAAALGAKPDADLLETLTFVTEYPTAIRGDFDPSFLALPAEVLTTVLKHHQKTFSVESAPGVLAPHFVAIMNTSGDPDGWVKRGNEGVIRARFSDARFFWDVDQQKTLDERVPDLAKVTFHAKLGSYLDKTKRVISIVKELGGNADAQRAALLCKTDLTTEMVKEFTDLQGIVGGLYEKVRNEPKGEHPGVWRAIYDHYRPLSMEDRIPDTQEGQIVALADKLDTLRECFRIGMVPTGSKDPFALRRAAQGVVKILVEAIPSYDLNRLQTLLSTDARLYPFVLERINFYFKDVRGFKYDEVSAVLKPGTLTNFGDIQARLVALAEVRPTDDFEPVAASAKRIRKILDQATEKTAFKASGRVDESLLEPGPERDLYDAVVKVEDDFPVWRTKDYKASLLAIASLRPRVDLFFDNVMVNAENELCRVNRLELLNRLLGKFSTIADFSEIVTAGDKTGQVST